MPERKGGEFDGPVQIKKIRDGRPAMPILDAVMLDVAMASRVILLKRRRKVSTRQAFKMAETYFPRPKKDITYSHKNIERACYDGALMSLLSAFGDAELESFAMSPEQIAPYLADPKTLTP